MMPEQNLRFECLRLAIDGGHHKQTVEKAQAFYDFVQGAKDGVILSAARELAKKVAV